MQELTFSGKTIEQAIEAAARDLGVAQDAVRYEVLEEGHKGLFSRQDAVIRILTDARKERAQRFMEAVVEHFPLQGVSVSVSEEEQVLRIEVSGEDASYLIGRRGETLNALQYLAGLVVNNGENKYCRVTLNINGYREKREKTLEALARRLAGQAVRTGRSVTLEPMAPYERRIIHATVQQVEHAQSASIGEEPNRRVVISSDQPRPQREDRRDGRRDRGGRNRSRSAEPRRQQNSDSLIQDDFLTSSSTIEGMKKEKALRDAALPLYTKVELD